jgi:vitamin B12 transporter
VSVFFVYRCALAASLLALAFGTAHAAEPAPSPSPSAAPAPSPSPSVEPREIGRVSTSDRRVEPLGTTSRPTFVVDREQIEAYGARSVADALQDVPGLNVTSYGPFGSGTFYGIRGTTSSEQTLVLVDGVPVTDPTTGGVELGQLSTVGVSRIEVVESGASTLYGTSAVGGVINVITSVPRGVYLAASDGSFADRDLRVGAGDGRIGLSYERHVVTDAYPYPAFNYGPGSCAYGTVQPCTFAAGSRSNAYADQSAARLALDLPLDARWTVRAQANLASIGIGVPGQLGSLTPGDSQAEASNGAQLELERVSGASTYSLSASGAQQRQTSYDTLYSNGESDVYWGRGQLSLKDAIAGSRSDAVVGIDLSRQSGVFAFPSSPNYATPGATPIPAYGLGAAESQSAAYVQLGTSPLQGTRLTAGLRAERDAPQGSTLAPSLGGTARFGTFRLAGNIGESFRVPTLQDLYYPGYSNPNLVPEKSSNSDVTLAYEGRAADLSVGWFGRSGSNFIVLDPTTYIPFNAQRARTGGIAVTASSHEVAGLVASVSYTDVYEALDVTSGLRLPFSPVGSATVALSHPFGRDRFAFGLRYGIVGSDGQDASNVTPPLTSTYDAWSSLDAYVRYKLAPGAILSLRGYNLGNEQSAPFFGYPALGRRFAVEFATR